MALVLGIGIPVCAGVRGRAGRLGRIPERHMLKRHGTRHVGHGEIASVGGIADLGVKVQVLKDPVEERQRACDLHLEVEQLAHREEQPALQRGERHDVARGGCRGIATARQAARKPVDKRGRNGEHGPGDHEEPSPNHRLTDLQPRKLQVQPAIPGDIAVLRPKGLAQQHPRDGECLLGDCAQLGESLLRLGADGPANLAHPVGQVQEERQHPQREHRQPPVDQEHRHDGGQRDRQVLCDRRRRVRDHALDTAHVVGQPALDLAGPCGREEPQRHALQVGVERVAEVLHHVLANEVVEVRLANTQKARPDGHDNHQRDIPVEQLKAAANDDVVDQQLEQVRVDEAQKACCEDGAKHHQHLSAVGAEEPRHALGRACSSLPRDPLEVDGRQLGARGNGGSALKRADAATAERHAVAASPPVWEVAAVSSSQRSASMAARQPSPAAVTACR